MTSRLFDTWLPLAVIGGLMTTAAVRNTASVPQSDASAAASSIGSEVAAARPSATGALPPFPRGTWVGRLPDCDGSPVYQAVEIALATDGTLRAYRYSPPDIETSSAISILRLDASEIQLDMGQDSQFTGRFLTPYEVAGVWRGVPAAEIRLHRIANLPALWSGAAGAPAP